MLGMFETLMAGADDDPNDEDGTGFVKVLTNVGATSGDLPC